MKRVKTGLFLVVTALSLGTALLVGPVANAHIFRSDGAISAELHVEPDDAPVTNIPVRFRLSFYESGGTFSLKDCRCSVAFIKNGATTAHQDLAAGTDSVSENTVTFIEPGTYTFKVTGAPKRPGSFPPFTLSYEEHVGTAATAQTNSPLTWGVIGLASAAVLGYALMAVLRRLSGRVKR